MSHRFHRNFIHKSILLTAFLSLFTILKAQMPDTNIADTSSVEVLLPVNEPEIDTTLKVFKEHSPYKAALYSAVIPGLGQIYNRKYWKTPIVYIGFSTLVYYTWQMNYYYNEYRKAYADYYPDNDFDDDYQLPGFSENLLFEEQLTKGVNEYRRWRDMDIILMVGLYFLNIVDATVDAHFFNYDVSNDISLDIHPIYTAFNNRSVKLGLQLSILF